MTETLRIKHFGPLLDVILDLKQTLVFIGPQSSGKSTIAKLIAIFRNPSFLISIDNSLSENITHTQNYYTTFFQNYNILNFFQHDTYLNYDSKYYNIVYQADQFKLSYKLADSQQTKVDEVKMELQKLDIPFVILPLQTSYVEVLSTLKQLFGEHRESFHYPVGNTSTATYIPAERLFITTSSGTLFSLINNNVPIAKNILEFGAQFEQARSKLNRFHVDFLNVMYKYQHHQDTVQLKSGKFIKLIESASGLQAVIPLLMVIENNYQEKTGRLFVVEEPELNLYPLVQRDLIHFLVARGTFTRTVGKNEKANELVITTHSPYILAALNNCLLAYRAAILRPDQMETLNDIIPTSSWLDPSKFNAYYVEEGHVENIFNRDTGAILDSKLEEATNVLRGEFKQLMNLSQMAPSPMD